MAPSFATRARGVFVFTVSAQQGPADGRGMMAYRRRAAPDARAAPRSRCVYARWTVWRDWKTAPS